jgi:primary-amine oxidase
MPVDYAKFTLKPYGFFGANPTLNVPASEPVAHCSHGGEPEVHGAHASPAAAPAAPAAGGSACAGHADHA